MVEHSFVLDTISDAEQLCGIIRGMVHGIERNGRVVTVVAGYDFQEVVDTVDNFMLAKRRERAKSE